MKTIEEVKEGKTLKFTDGVFKEIKSIAKANPSEEVCGVLFGKPETPETVSVAIPVTNRASNRNCSYVFDKQEFYALLKRSKLSKNPELIYLGVFHSHPSGYGSSPSYIDRANPPLKDSSYIIFDVVNEVFGIHYWDGKEFTTRGYGKEFVIKNG